MPTTLLSLSDELLEEITWHIALDRPAENERRRGFSSTLFDSVRTPRDWALACRQLANATAVVMNQFVCTDDAIELWTLARKLNQDPRRAAKARWMAISAADGEGEAMSVATSLGFIASSLVSLVRLEIRIDGPAREMLLDAVKLIPSLLHLSLSANPPDDIDVGYLQALSVATRQHSSPQSRLRSLVLDDLVLHGDVATSNASLDDCPAFPRLQFLAVILRSAVDNTDALDRFVLIEYAARHCPSLTALSYDSELGADPGVLGRVTGSLGAFGGLQRLDWSLDKASDAELAIVEALIRHARKLEVLSVKQTRLSVALLYKLSHLRVFSTSRAIDARQPDAISQSASLARIIANLPSLKTVFLPWLRKPDFKPLRTALEVRPELLPKLTLSQGASVRNDVRILARIITWVEWQAL